MARNHHKFGGPSSGTSSTDRRPARRSSVAFVEADRLTVPEVARFLGIPGGRALPDDLRRGARRLP
ncbi:MAG: hypothetical protein ACRDZQ_12460 [Acidimicrobiales bacterium]